MTAGQHQGQRHAVYWAPAPEHALWAAGCSWLGRDARAGQCLTPPARPGVLAPWRYGFHATLKAPITLACGAQVDDWLAAVRALAARHSAFDMPPLQVATLSGFVALRPLHTPGATHPLRRLADACVLDLDCWRAPQDASERARQTPQGASARQLQHLERHGYAHVLDDWRLHLTLSDSLPGAAALAALQADAEQHFAAALREPLRCDAVSVFSEHARGQAFVLSHSFPLAGGAVGQ